MAAVSTTVTHDEAYYFEDGSCVLKVENYLFNLHRSTLRRHSGFFRDMFAIPQEKLDDRGNTEGSSDDHPIVCSDSAEAFRAWCWVLYAGFNELKVAKEDENFTEKEYTHIAALSHKYGCDAIEKWARELLDAKLDQSESVPGGSKNIRKATLKYIVRTSMQCGWSHTQKTSETLLLDLTGRTAAGLREMLTFADSVSSSRLRARAYYAFLQSVNWQLSPAPGPKTGVLKLASEESISQSWWDPWYSLSDAEKITLYRGFHGLSRLQNQLRAIPHTTNGDSNCRCRSNWGHPSLQSMWDRVGKDLVHCIGPKEFLLGMKNRLSGDRQPCNDSKECMLVHLCSDIDQFLEKFDDYLVHFFPS